MSAPRRTVRAFERRMKDEQGAWPLALVKHAEAALFDLNFIAGNNPKIIEAIKKNVPSLWTDIVNDIASFESAYAEFRTTCSSSPHSPNRMEGWPVSPAEAPASTE